MKGQLRKSLHSQIFIRDRARCKYCSSKVLPRRLLNHKNILWYNILPRKGRIQLIVNKKLLEVHEGTMDHIKPKSKGGPTNEQNLCLSCSTCNHLKDKTPKLSKAMNKKLRTCPNCLNPKRINNDYCGKCLREFPEYYI